jgi:microcompartment protein CcmK/EutM
MILARITGAVHATIADPPLQGEKLLLAQPVGLDGAEIGRPLAAVDRVDAGVGDLVLVLKEGGSARALLGNDESPVQAVIVAVVDDVSLTEEPA